METSFSNAGMVSPGHAYTWASPRAPKILWQSLYRDDTALKFRLKADPALWAWSWKFLKECPAERAAINTANKLRLCIYSQGLFEEVNRTERVAYDRHVGGALYLYRDPGAFRPRRRRHEAPDRRRHAASSLWAPTASSRSSPLCRARRTTSPARSTARPMSPATATSSRMRSPTSSRATAASPSTGAHPSTASSPTAAVSPASRQARAPCRRTRMSWPWAATRRCSRAISACACRSIP